VDLMAQMAAAVEAFHYWQIQTPQRFLTITSIHIAQLATVQLAPGILETVLTARI
jgi:hypothetical protein